MFYGWRVVAGAFAGMVLTNGFFSYAFTVLVDPIRAEFGANLEQVMYSLTIGTLFGLVVSPGRLLRHYYGARELFSPRRQGYVLP